MYATLFDRKYLSRGISMIESLSSFDKDAAISVLCLDIETEIAVKAVGETLNVVAVTLNQIGNELILNIRGDRSYREFCWALSSIFCRYLLENQDSEVIYIDADVFFFGSPKTLLEECRTGDIAAIKHRFPERLRHYEVNGMFNVQWVYFANNEIGHKACAKWSEQCIECSSYSPDKGIVGDQKYLDEWPNLYQTFIDIQNLGAGVAPWNHESLKPIKVDGEWIVSDGSPLIFFHFHGFKVIDEGKVSFAPKMYSKVRKLPTKLYAEYVLALNKSTRRFDYLAENALITNTKLSNAASLKEIIFGMWR